MKNKKLLTSLVGLSIAFCAFAVTCPWPFPAKNNNDGGNCKQGVCSQDTGTDGYCSQDGNEVMCHVTTGNNTAILTVPLFMPALPQFNCAITNPCVAGWATTELNLHYAYDDSTQVCIGSMCTNPPPGSSDSGPSIYPCPIPSN